MAEERLPAHLQHILDFISKHTSEQGYAPTVREVCAAIGVASTSTVHSYLRRLEEDGYLRRDPAKPRAMVVLSGGDKTPAGDLAHEADEKGFTSQSEQPFFGRDINRLPVVPFAAINGDFAKDGPLPTDPHHQEWYIPGDVLQIGDYFVTFMPDESMTNTQIMPGDFLIVKRQNTANNGDLILGLANGESLVRTYYKGLRQVRLQPECDHLDATMIKHEDLVMVGVLAGYVHMF